MKFSNIRDKFEFLPDILFILTLLLQIACVLIPDYFVTHDGTAHLFNAQVILDLLTSSDSFYSHYFTFNEQLIQPNLISHVLLTIFLFFLQYAWAEKLLIVVYIILFSVGFRFYLKQTVTHYSWYSLLIFPFVLNAILFWGFYNFLLGLGTMLVFLGLLEKYKTELTVKRIIILFFLTVVLFFSHALVLLFTGLAVGLRIVIQLLQEKKWSASFLIYLAKIVLVFLPATILLLLYLVHQSDTGTHHEPGYSIAQRFSQLLLTIDSIKYLGYAEPRYVTILYLILMLIACVNCYWAIQKKQWDFFSYSFIILIVYFLIYLLIPDSSSGGGIIVLRINLVLFIYMILWIANGQINIFIKSCIVVYVVVSGLLLVLRWDFIDANAQNASYYVKTVSAHIPDKTIFSPVRKHSPDMLYSHYVPHTYLNIYTGIDHYIALEKHSISINNYEVELNPSSSYFPLVWKAGYKPELRFDKLSNQSQMLHYIGIDRFNVSNPQKRIDYIISFGISDRQELEKYVPQQYSLYYRDSLKLIDVYKVR